MEKSFSTGRDFLGSGQALGWGGARTHAHSHKDRKVSRSRLQFTVVGSHFCQDGRLPRGGSNISSPQFPPTLGHLAKSF